MTFTELRERQRLECVAWFMALASWRELASAELLDGKLSEPAEYLRVDSLCDVTGQVNGQPSLGGKYGEQLRAALREGYAVLAGVWDSAWAVVLTDDGQTARRL